MQIIIIIGFVMALTLHQAGPHPQAPAWLTFAAIGGYLLGLIAAAALNAAAARRLLRRDPPKPSQAGRRHRLGGFLVTCWLLGGQVAVALLGYGRWVAASDALQRIPLAGEAAAVAPLLAGVLLVWLLGYPFYRDAHRIAAEVANPTRVWTLGQYLAYNVRHHLLFILVPVGLILLAADAIQLATARWLSPPLGDYIQLGGTLLAAAGVFFFAPLLIVHVWKTAPLPDGPLREQLQAACRRLGLTYRRLLLWRSGGVIANAGVMGLAGPVRYILLSDGLLTGAEPRDVQAIFAHEAGHVVHHHIFYGGLFAMGSISLVASAGETLGAALAWDAWMVQTAVLGGLAGVWAVGFGWISRRFERQCDVLAAWTAGPREQGDDPDRITQEGAAVFAHALQRIAQINGLSPSQFNWRHGSIAHRAEYVLYLGSTRGTRRTIDRTVRKIKLALWLLAAAGLAGVIAIEMTVHA